MKTIIITGANSGLGFELSKEMARKGYYVIMGCRDRGRAHVAKENILKEVPNAHIQYIPLDLEDRESIYKFAEIFKNYYDHLDVLVNNAGIMSTSRIITNNNQELQFDVNHLGHFLLTSLLIDMLNQEYETRVVTLTSMAHHMKNSVINFEDITFSENYKTMTAYGQSKFANALFARELSKRVKGTNIKSVCVHPGVSNTELFKSYDRYMTFLKPVIKKVIPISEAADGAKHLEYAVISEDVANGDYVGPVDKHGCKGQTKHVKFPDKTKDKALAIKLWKYSEDELGIKFNIKNIENEVG